MEKYVVFLFFLMLAMGCSSKSAEVEEVIIIQNSSSFLFEEGLANLSNFKEGYERSGDLKSYLDKIEAFNSSITVEERNVSALRLYMEIQKGFVFSDYSIKKVRSAMEKSDLNCSDLGVYDIYFGNLSEASANIKLFLEKFEEFSSSTQLSEEDLLQINSSFIASESARAMYSKSLDCE